MDSVYKTAFHALSVGALIIEREDRERFKILDANEASARVGRWRGRNPAKIIGNYVHETFGGIRDVGLLSKYNEALDAGSAIHLAAFPYADLQSNEGIFDVDLHPLSVDTLLITYSNVTERIRAEENLRSSEAQLRAMMENTPDYIMLLDLDGKIKYINRTVPDLTVTGVLGTSLFDYLAEEKHEVVKACFQRVRESLKPDSYEVVYRSKEGELTSFETSVGPIIQGGEVVSYITSSRDISVFRQAEARMSSMSIQLLEAQETERSKIAQELHDEVGGLLASIQISLALIPDEQKNNIIQLRELTSIVDSLIDVVRSLTLSLRPELLNTRGLEETVSQLIERYSIQTQVEVDLSSLLEPGVRFKPEIETAAYRIVQEALTNVARHAKVKKAGIEFSVVADELCISVIDEGMGFMVQEDSEDQKTLGLSGMYQRASVLGGDVNISSQPGAGTRIDARFPLVRPFATRTRS